ncbi:MAG: CBS domain-containing protein, partial [Saprospiraceae bacterium]|nr:CBS domain-containing protein [Saprospiraceae bacterium]
MGDFNIRPIRDKHDRAKMYAHAINDISAFESLLEQERFESGAPKIGLEQELCLVDSQLEPAKAALEILDDLQLKAYTNELALFNLEINGDPLDLKDKCFSLAERNLLKLLQAGVSKAKDRNLQLLLCGILPTLQYRHLAFSYMTPIQRYQVLSKMLADLRGDQFEIYLQGVDELIMSLESVLFEACNTSFQLHLQIAPEDFIRKYNWSQMIAGPVLAACTNSPLLFGRELWAETRIALFKQSLDTRSSRNHLRKKQARVYFGHDWLRHSPAELWKNELMRFP